MALAPAGKKSRPSASRSTSTTASSAKAGKKNAEKSDVDWTVGDQANAFIEGWGLFTVVDEITRKVFLEIFEHGSRLKNDNKAREHVVARAKAGDALAVRAIRAVFRSKVDPRGRK